jgi:hypothetical protein
LLALLLLIAVPAAFAHDVETPVRDCGTRAYGDLGRGWQARAVVAGPLAFVGLRDGYAAAGSPPAGTAWPQKVLVVVEPASVATVTIARRSQRYAALGYHELRHDATKPVPLSAGTAASASRRARGRIQARRFGTAARSSPATSSSRAAAASASRSPRAARCSAGPSASAPPGAPTRNASVTAVSQHSAA